MGTSSVTFLTIIPLIFCYTHTHKPLLLYQQTGKSAKTRSAKASSDDPRASQTKRKDPKSTKSQAKRQKTAPPSSPPPVSPIHVESSPSTPEIQTQQAPSPPQPQEIPQTEEISTDVPEQAVDPTGHSIGSLLYLDKHCTPSR
jgi:hypothetical protein